MRGRRKISYDSLLTITKIHLWHFNKFESGTLCLIRELKIVDQEFRRCSSPDILPFLCLNNVQILVDDLHQRIALIEYVLVKVHVYTDRSLKTKLYINRLVNKTFKIFFISYSWNVGFIHWVLCMSTNFKLHNQTEPMFSLVGKSGGKIMVIWNSET